jgi:hypothetical protein
MRFSARALLVLLALAVPATPPPAAAERPFAFAVTGDPHSAVDAFRQVLQAVRDLPGREAAPLPPAEFLLVAGDLHALEKEHAAFREVFAGFPAMRALLPMTGDHATDAQRAYMSKEILAGLPQVRIDDPAVVSYTFDWRNVRVIVADPNHPAHGAKRFLTEAGCRWVEEQIRSAPPSAEHLFVAFHEPPFPRERHVDEMTDAKRPLRDAFWTMLLKNRDRVRAVFTGHTHYYNRMRVADPGGAAANDPKQFPDEAGGIWQVSTPTSGARTEELGFVQVVVEGPSVKAVVLERKEKDPAFRVVDTWPLSDAAAAPAGK